MRALGWIALVVAAAACGHYAAPERAREPKQKTAPVSAAPAQTAAADEQCEEEMP
jgi:hypothetical protein